MRKVQIRPWIKPGIAFLQSISRATTRQKTWPSLTPLPSSPRPPPVESAPGLPSAPFGLPPSPPGLPPAPPGSSARFPTGPARFLTGPRPDSYRTHSISYRTHPISYRSRPSLTGPARPPGGDRIRPVPGRSRSGRNSAIWAGIPRNRLRRDPREPRLVWRRKYPGPNSMDCFLPIQPGRG